MKIQNEQLEIIRSLVGGSITIDNLAFVDSFVHDWFGMFVPIGGNCGYAITPSHTHPSYMFVIAYDDESIFYVAEKKFQSSAYSMFCLAPNIPHHEIQNYLPPKYCAIFIDEQIFKNNFQHYSNDIDRINMQTVDTNNTKIERYIKEFIAESQNNHASSKVVLENISTLLIHEIIRAVLKYGTIQTQFSTHPKIDEAIKYIDSNYEKNISLDDLANIILLSKSHFIKLFTINMNTTPIEYLKQIRVENGKKMLMANKLSITQISRQCGFNSPSYFSKTFKSVYNETPKEFITRVK